MDFSRKSRAIVEKRSPVDDLEQLYPHSVMIYHLPPMEDISLQMFEELAVERLKVHRILEQASSKNLRYLSDEYKNAILEELNLHKLKYYHRLIQHGGSTVSNTKREFDLTARQRDYISHFILRLVYCRTDDLRRWFISREMELFKLKFSYLTTAEIVKFLELSKLEYAPLNEEEIIEIKDGLHESTVGPNLLIEQLQFYKIPFIEVLDLVKNRKCYLKNGYAYVSTNDFVSVVASIQENAISQGLGRAQRFLLPHIETDERLVHLIRGLHTSYTGKDYTVGSADYVPIESLDQLAKKSFPLCMRMCHESLRIKHHHKHGARMQYGLFLKGIGVTLEDSLRFWQEEFTKLMDVDKFQKTYAYNIRHNYGKEGSMTNYTPYSCMKIITGAVGPNEAHGCPYKLMDPVALRTKLLAYGISNVHAQEIVDYARKGHAQLACGRYFEVTMNTKCLEGINHPNQYFEVSQQIMNERAGKTKSTSNRKDLVTLNNKSRTTAGDKSFDPSFDDELWNVVSDAQSQADQTQQMKCMENDNDFDVSQMEF